jgi:hypothetical protein
MNQQISGWGASLMSSLSPALALLFVAVPRIFGFLVILGIGWLFAWLVERLVVAVLRTLHVDRYAERAGMSQTFRQAPSAILGLVGKWFVRLITLVVAFDELGVPAVSQVFHQLLMWLPNLAVALAVLFVGGVAAGALGDMVRAAGLRRGVARPDLPAAIAKWGIWTFAALVAANQIGIASTMVDILFTAIVGAVALALGLSFGLGARDTAGNIVRDLYNRHTGNGQRTIDGTLAAANQPRNVGFNGIEQRRALRDRRG